MVKKVVYRQMIANKRSKSKTGKYAAFLDACERYFLENGADKVFNGKDLAADVRTTKGKRLFAVPPLRSVGQIMTADKQKRFVRVGTEVGIQTFAYVGGEVNAE